MSAGPDETRATGDIVREPDGRRTHVRSFLMMESLMDRTLIESTHGDGEVPIFPDVALIMLGGASIFDRGRGALLPLVDEIIANRPRHPMIIGVGGGIRERHTYAIGLDLGLPVGALAMIAGAIGEQNALLLQVLLSRADAIRIAKEDFPKLPIYLKSGSIPIIVAMPPYHYWEQPSRETRLPQHGSDAGIYLLSEVFSTRSCIYVKDTDGVFTADPRTDPRAKLIRRVSAAALLKDGPTTLPIDRTVLEIMLTARNSKAIRLINGLVPGTLTRALEGEDVGTLIHQ